MTFKESMVKMMTSRGMFQSQAEEVLVKYIGSDEDNPMMDSWNYDVNGYPEAMQKVLWIGVKDYAAKWIQVNMPQAWFRPMFEYSDLEIWNKIQSGDIPMPRLSQ